MRESKVNHYQLHSTMGFVVGTLLLSGHSTLAHPGPAGKSGPCCVCHSHPGVNNLFNSPLLCPPWPPKDTKGILPKGLSPHALCFFTWQPQPFSFPVNPSIVTHFLPSTAQCFPHLKSLPVHSQSRKKKSSEHL